MSRRRIGQITRFGLCLIMAGVAIYCLFNLVTAAEAVGTIVLGCPGSVTGGSTHPYNGCIAQFLNIGHDTVDSLFPYLGGVVIVAAAGLFLECRKYAGDNNHCEIIAENLSDTMVEIW